MILVGALIVGASVTEPVKAALSLQSGLGEAGKWWQALSCHMVHFGWGHFWRDGPALALLSGLIEVRSRAALLAVLGIAVWVVPAAVLLSEPEILPYRGASGLVVAAFAWLGGNAIQRRDADRLARLAGVLALVVLAVKIWLEIAEGRLMEGESGEVIVVSWSAHLAGALVGLFLALFKEGFSQLPGSSLLRKTKGSRS